MSITKASWTPLGVGAIAAIACLSVATVQAQWKGTAEKQKQGKEVTMTGRVVDLHCFMTEQYASADHTKCTAECIRSGVPAALETEDGILLLGEGMKGPMKTLMPLAFQHVEIKGKLYDKHGVKYLDITSAKQVAMEEMEETEGEGTDY